MRTMRPGRDCVMRREMPVVIGSAAQVPAPSFPTGPAIGERFPDFTLPDQDGNPVGFTAARRGRRAIVVIHRSAAW